MSRRSRPPARHRARGFKGFSTTLLIAATCASGLQVVEYYKCIDMVYEFDGARAIDEVWTDTKAAIQAMMAKYDADK